MALPQSNYITEAEYLAFERDSDLRHEYVAGEILAMSGASYRHIVIMSRLTSALFRLTNDGETCEVFFNDLKVRIATANAYRYPDVALVCNEPDIENIKQGIITNPTAIIEVLSDSTARIDQIDKLYEYRQLPSLQAYLMVSQHAPRIERYQRQDANNWLYTDVAGLDGEIALPGMDAPLTLAAVYRNVDFDAPTAATPDNEQA